MDVWYYLGSYWCARMWPSQSRQRLSVHLSIVVAAVTDNRPKTVIMMMWKTLGRVWLLLSSVNNKSNTPSVEFAGKHILELAKGPNENRKPKETMSVGRARKSVAQNLAEDVRFIHSCQLRSRYDSLPRLLLTLVLWSFSSPPKSPTPWHPGCVQLRIGCAPQISNLSSICLFCIEGGNSFFFVVAMIGLQQLGHGETSHPRPTLPDMVGKIQWSLDN